MGSLWGLAWGDVLGCPIEGWSAAEIVDVFGAYQLPEAPYPEGVPAKKRARLRPLGVHSDDTQQALALINVCLSGWSLDAWTRCLVGGAHLKAWRGTGRHFDAAVQKLTKGEAAKRAGSPSAGIGAAMRAAPLGALFRDQSRTLVEVAMESSAVTHGDLRSIALAYAVAWSCARLVNGATVDQVRAELPDAVAEGEDEWLHGKSAWAVDRAGRHQLSLGLARVLAVLPQTVVGLGVHVTRLGRPFADAKFAPAHANHAFALLGGLYGLSAALLDDVDPAATLLGIVRQGEDTDTVAAIAGGVLGARFGSAWVPKHRLQDRARLEVYARALATRAAAPESIAALLDHEAALTTQELAFQADPRWPR